LVLIGTETWKRKHVDWEISSSIRNTEYNARSGLLGILLPTHPDFNRGQFYYKNIPPRLADNHKIGYSEIYEWSSDLRSIMSWIDEAFNNKDKKNPDNSRPMFGKNKTGDFWTD
jgi:hypothetical protein